MEKLLSEFEAKVEKSEGCWNWNGAIDSHGYGKIYIKSKIFKAHRIAYELYVGNLPKWDGYKSGVCVLHKCDNPRCVNPEHLFLGSHAENMRDKTLKGRAVGANACEKHHKAKLTKEQVLIIRQDLRSNSTIGKDYGVSKETIRGIKRMVTWKSL